MTTWQAVRATHAKASEAVQRQKAEANEQKAVAAQKAEAEAELIARQRAYASDMNAAMQALNDNSLGQALDLLNRQRPQPGQKDLRGWEWRYLWQQTRSDATVHPVPDKRRGQFTGGFSRRRLSGDGFAS